MIVTEFFVARIGVSMRLNQPASGSLRREPSPTTEQQADVDAIPMDSTTRALVVIPTISRRKHSKSNSARGGK